ncbi:hypothetical protein Tsubulata_019729 [Turnera subulata]|uniref:Vacuolar membrane protease n=1 Tax=Turnera subulata TaxID=218843 RepID=A0A9Q0GDA2_9ROSI|nr:hypothetical protein Tsubulata_019729 [Turnera subulata]
MRKLLAPTLNQSQSAWPEFEKGRSSSSRPPPCSWWAASPCRTDECKKRCEMSMMRHMLMVKFRDGRGEWRLVRPLAPKRLQLREFVHRRVSQLGPRPVGSQSLDRALQCVLSAAEEIKETADPEVGVEVDVFRAESGANRLGSGAFEGKTLVYSDLVHIILRITPKNKYGSEAAEDIANAILVSAHIDTGLETSSDVSVMLELARGVSQQASGFKNSVIFLFNSGEEEGLNGAHSFVTQIGSIIHPWSDTIRLAVDLEALGIGGKSGIFQAGPDSWGVEKFASAAKYPSGNVIAQDIFSSGVIKSATDFQVYNEVSSLSGLDLAYTDNTAVYHTKNDKVELLKPGSLQHLGENLLPFLLEAASSSDLPEGKTLGDGGKTGHESSIFFYILVINI